LVQWCLGESYKRREMPKNEGNKHDSQNESSKNFVEEICEEEITRDRRKTHYAVQKGL